MLEENLSLLPRQPARRGQHRSRSARQVHRQVGDARRVRRCRRRCARRSPPRSRRAAAMAAFPPDARRDVLEHCVRRFSERQDELALALCIEAGKPIKDARGEVTRLIDTFRIAAEEATRIDGEVIEAADLASATRGYRGMVKRVPVGAVLVHHAVQLPAQPGRAQGGARDRGGLPVRAQAGGEDAGRRADHRRGAGRDRPAARARSRCCRAPTSDAGPLVEDERLELLSFTGGMVGWDLKARAGRKKVVLELGGNAACIVDADGRAPRRVVERLVFGAYYQSGQSCISVQRIFAHADVYDALRDALRSRSRKLRMGDPRDEDVFIGPMIDEAAARRLEWLDRRTRSPAAHVAVRRRARRRTCSPATLLEGVPHDSDLYRKEAFGPVALHRAVRRVRRRARARQRQRLRTAGGRVHRQPRPRDARVGRAGSGRRRSSATCRASASTTCPTAA